VTTPPERRFVTLGEPMNLAPVAVLALDQALATQDALVRARTLPGLDRLRHAGCTVLLASHEDRLLETLCDEVWWLEAGELAGKGDPRETVTRYRRFVAEQVRAWGETLSPRLAPSFRRGDGRAEVISIETLGPEGQSTIVWKSGEHVSVRATVRFHDAVQDPVIGMLIRTQIGFEVYGTNTELEGLKIGRAWRASRSRWFSRFCAICARRPTRSRSPRTIRMAPRTTGSKTPSPLRLSMSATPREWRICGPKWCWNQGRNLRFRHGDRAD
jgi:hypothetical protein